MVGKVRRVPPCVDWTWDCVHANRGNSSPECVTVVGLIPAQMSWIVCPGRGVSKPNVIILMIFHKCKVWWRGKGRRMGVGTRLRQGMHLRVALRCCDIALFRLHPLRACLTWRLHTTAHHCRCPCHTHSACCCCSCCCCYNCAYFKIQISNAVAEFQ